MSFVGHESRNSSPEDLSGGRLEQVVEDGGCQPGEFWCRWSVDTYKYVLFVHICEFLLYLFIHKNTFSIIDLLRNINTQFCCI